MEEEDVKSICSFAAGDDWHDSLAASAEGKVQGRDALDGRVLQFPDVSRGWKR